MEHPPELRSVQCVVLVLNTWAAAPQSTNRNPDDYRCFQASASKNLCPAQTAAHAHFDLMTDQFVRLWKSNKVKPRSWTELLTRRLDSYAGIVTTKAHDVSCEQVVPSLPPMGLAGRVSAADLSEGRLREILLDPDKLVRPRSEWPRTFKRARVRAKPVEWHRLAAELVRRQILRVLEDHEAVYDSEGNRLGAGLFGVPKGQSITLSSGDVAEVLRLIINLIPANEILRMLMGDVHTLPYVGQWSNVNLDGDMVLWSAEDLRCGFYLFGLPAGQSGLRWRSQCLASW